MLGAGCLGGGHAEAAAGRVAVGEDVEPPVAADLDARGRVHVHLDVHEFRTLQRAGRQVGEPQVVARGGAGRGGHRQPAAVAADRDAVVVRLVEPVAEHHDVGVRVRPDVVQEHAAVVLLLAGRDVGRGEPADVVVRLAARDPRDGGVARAVDRAVDDLAGGHVHDAHGGLLRAADGELVGEQAPVLRRLPRVQRGRAARVDRHRVEQDALSCAVLRRVDRDEHGVLLLGRAAHQELSAAAPVRGGDDAGAEQRHRAGTQRVHARPGRALGVEQGVLRLRPGFGGGVGGVFQPAVRVCDLAAVQVLDDVLAGGVGVIGSRHGRKLSGPSFPSGRRCSCRPCRPSPR